MKTNNKTTIYNERKILLENKAQKAYNDCKNKGGSENGRKKDNGSTEKSSI